MARQGIKVYLREAIESGFKFIKRAFANVRELNENFKAQRNLIYKEVDRKADYKRRLARVLEVLKVHSCKHLGISYMTENHLCEEYSAMFGETISKRTVGNMIKHLKELALISTIATKRKDGKQSANIIVMERLESAVQKPATGEESALKTDAPAGEKAVKPAYKKRENLHTEITKSSLKTPDKDQEERKAKDRRILNFIPKWFKEKISCCATQPKAVLEYWKVAKHLTKRVHGKQLSNEEAIAVVSDAVLEFYKAAKAASRGAFAMGNPYGFFFEVLRVEIGGYVRRRAFAAQEEHGLYTFA